MKFIMEKRGLEGLVAEVISINETCSHLMPLDMEQTGEGVIKWLERRVIPKNRAFIDINNNFTAFCISYKFQSAL